MVSQLEYETLLHQAMELEDIFGQIRKQIRTECPEYESKTMDLDLFEGELSSMYRMVKNLIKPAVPEKEEQEM